MWTTNEDFAMRFDSRQFKPACVAAMVLAGSLAALPAGAALHDRGGGFIYDDVLNVTWTQDANLFLTQVTADAGVVNHIIEHTPSITDAFWGTADLSSNPFDGSGSHFNTANGTMTWYGAHAWVNYLNAHSYGGYNDWRLPTVAPLNGTNFVEGNSSADTLTLYNGNADVGWNNGHVQTELGHLLYGDLGITGSKDAVGNDTVPNWPNAGPFANFGLTNFWTGTEFTLADPDAQMFFFGNNGFQGGGEKPFFYFRAWAVRDGNSAVAAVPLPAGVWLLGSSLAGLAASGRRRRLA
jgi:hypothetical protein